MFVVLMVVVFGFVVFYVMFVMFILVLCLYLILFDLCGLFMFIKCKIVCKKFIKDNDGNSILYIYVF